jgi:Xaa-Pro aminopeptidase
VTSIATRPTIYRSRYADRLSRAATAAAHASLDALLIGVGPDLAYLTGYGAIVTERLTMLVLPASGSPSLVVPRLERPAAEAGIRTDLVVETWEETDDPYRLIARLLGEAGHTRRAGVSDRLWALHLLRFQATLPETIFSSASAALRTLRIVKDADEIELLRLAAEAADRVVDQIAAGPLIGRTEADVARDVRDRLIAEGHDTAEFAIVASGPNSASPHHEASERVIQAGEPIVLDIGGLLGGYASDTTRTLWVTGGDPAKGPDEAYRHRYAILLAAQESATRAIRPGIAAEAVDAVARDLITAEGYGEQFIHRTGHGIGLEGHEDPYLVAGNPETLAEGMAFSIEPGIYVANEAGARIEDIVVCGSDGPIALNRSSRALRVVDG